jgi:hypothetical protein
MFMIHSNKFLFRICSTCRKHFRSFPHSWLIIRFVFRVTRRVPLVGQEPFTLPEHLSAPAGVRVTRSLVLCLILCRSLFDFLSLFIWSFCCLSCDLRILITSLVYCSHCVVCPVIYAFWLPLWYIVVIVLSVLWFTHSDYLFGILLSLCCLSFLYLRILITSLVYCSHCVVCPVIYGFWLPLWYIVVIVLSVLLWFTHSDYLFGIL